MYRTIILPFVLYGCESWSLILREEHRLRVSENKGLRKVGTGRDSKHNEKLHDPYYSQNIRVAISRWLIRWSMWYV